MFEKMRFIMSQVWDFLAPLIRAMMTEAGPVLARAAMDAVASVATSMQSADGPDKRAAAFDQIKDSLARQGIALATSTINAAIEAAVLRIKAGKQ